ncbi:hypothetical protein GCM10009838_11740 [Catenulispora subtropica]|uniref:Uncharacterized protein n=1 Tax=Catenulispora subtropica TaxID=450798 RepID=A0ABP5C686_9ACTN
MKGGWDMKAEETELRRRSRHLLRIVRPEHEPNPQVRDHLERLQRWQGAVTHPAVRLLLVASRLEAKVPTAASQTGITAGTWTMPATRRTAKSSGRPARPGRPAGWPAGAAPG